MGVCNTSGKPMSMNNCHTMGRFMYASTCNTCYGEDIWVKTFGLMNTCVIIVITTDIATEKIYACFWYNRSTLDIVESERKKAV
jgi:hypothetical protein